MFDFDMALIISIENDITFYTNLLNYHHFVLKPRLSHI